MNLSWQFKHFTELTTMELHDLIQLRLQTFVVEQNCVYQDLDGKDKKSYHLICRDGFGDIIGTARIIPAGISYPEVSIGRFVIAEDKRGNQYGIGMMNRCMEFIKAEFGNVAVRISAQQYLEKFYNRFGFQSTDKKYLEDGIPHLEMLYQPEN